MNIEPIHGEKIYAIHDFLSTGQLELLLTECESLDFESPQEDSGGGLTSSLPGEHGARVSLPNETLARELWTGASSVIPETLEHERASGFDSVLHYFRCCKGEGFPPCAWNAIVASEQVRRMVLVYLNDGFTGGGTEIYLHKEVLSITPKAGMALVLSSQQIFEHLAVQQGTKYVLCLGACYELVEEEESTNNSDGDKPGDPESPEEAS